MKSVLMSIQPYWVFLIIARKMGWNIDKEKTIEVRKNFPKDKDWNRNVEIYCSKDKKSFSKIPKEYQPLMEKFLGKVIGEFVCDRIDDFSRWEYDYFSLLRHINLFAGTNGDYKFLNYYLKGQKNGYGWHITDLKIYDTPKDLSKFKKAGWLSYDDWLYGLYPNTHCTYDALAKRFEISKPPQSWCYVEELQNG